MVDVGFHLWIGGRMKFFPFVKYVGGQMLAWNVDMEKMCFAELKHIIDQSAYVGAYVSIWYLKPMFDLKDAMVPVLGEIDVMDFVGLWRKFGSIEVYVDMGVDDVDMGVGDVENLVVDDVENLVVDDVEEIDRVVDESSVLSEELEVDAVEAHEDFEFEDEDWNHPYTKIDSESDISDEEVLECVHKAKGYRKRVTEGTADFGVYLGSRTGDVDESSKDNSAEEMDDIDGSSDDTNYHDGEEFEWSEPEQSEAEEKATHRQQSRKIYYNSQRHSLSLRMIFNGSSEFKEACVTESIKKQVQIEFRPNDKKRVRCICKDKTCPFVAFASVKSNTDEFKLKTFIDKHTCPKSFKNKWVTSKYLAKRFMSLWRAAPALKLTAFRMIVKEELNQHISPMKAHRTRDFAKKVIEGDYKHEFSRLWNYAAEIDRSNPGSTVRIKHRTLDGEEKLRFERMYICFDALKKGFKEGCRPIIGLDGCFLKGLLKGQLIVAVGRDGNNQMYPFAWAVVEVENTDSWRWFLKLLKEDLDTPDGNGYSLISDQQKGLLKAVHELWPNSEHRLCARHIYANWRKRNSGKDNKRIFWRAAKSTTVADFNSEVAKLDKKCLDDLLKYNPHTWSKAFFLTFSKCDIVNNNLTEAFNASVVDARHMGIISMLETIRISCMKRIISKYEQCQKWNSEFGPWVKGQLEDNKANSRGCNVHWGDNRCWEISEGTDVYVVVLGDRTCSCRVWDLTGIPCKHAVIAISANKEHSEQYVSHWFKKELYQTLYTHRPYALVGDRFWPESTMEEIIPPVARILPGRPKKKRILEEGEGGSSTRISRKGMRMRCQKCFNLGHNSRKCPKDNNPIDGATAAGSINAENATHPVDEATADGPINAENAHHPVTDPTVVVKRKRTKKGKKPMSLVDSTHTTFTTNRVKRKRSKRKTVPTKNLEADPHPTTTNTTAMKEGAGESSWVIHKTPTRPRSKLTPKKLRIILRPPTQESRM